MDVVRDAVVVAWARAPELVPGFVPRFSLNRLAWACSIGAHWMQKVIRDRQVQEAMAEMDNLVVVYSDAIEFLATAAHTAVAEQSKRADVHAAAYATTVVELASLQTAMKTNQHHMLIVSMLSLFSLLGFLYVGFVQRRTFSGMSLDSGSHVDKASGSTNRRLSTSTDGSSQTSSGPAAPSQGAVELPPGIESPRRPQAVQEDVVAVSSPEAVTSEQGEDEDGVKDVASRSEAKEPEAEVVAGPATPVAEGATVGQAQEESLAGDEALPPSSSTTTAGKPASTEDVSQSEDGVLDTPVAEPAQPESTEVVGESASHSDDGAVSVAASELNEVRQEEEQAGVDGEDLSGESPAVSSSEETVAASAADWNPARAVEDEFVGPAASAADADASSRDGLADQKPEAVEAFGSPAMATVASTRSGDGVAEADAQVVERQTRAKPVVTLPPPRVEAPSRARSPARTEVVEEEEEEKEEEPEPAQPGKSRRHRTNRVSAAERKVRRRAREAAAAAEAAAGQ